MLATSQVATGHVRPVATPHPPVRQICCVDGQPDSHVSLLDRLEVPQVELHLYDMLVEAPVPRLG